MMKPANFSLRDFEILLHVGEGAFGAVAMCRHVTKNNQDIIVALKRAKLGESKESDVLKEIQIQRELTDSTEFSKNILFAYGFFVENHYLYIILEYASKGSLREELAKAGGCFSENLSAQFLVNIVGAIDHCHKRNVIHRDIKPDNILLDCENTIKIADFGLATRSMNCTTICGTLGYMAPEISLGSYGKEVDTWAIGVLFYEFLVGTVPFRQSEPFNAWQLRDYSSISWHHIHVSDDAKAMITELLNPNRYFRSSLGSLHGHPFFCDTV